MLEKLQPLVVIAVASVGAIAPALLGHGLLMFDARHRAEAENATIATEMVARADAAVARVVSLTAKLAAAGQADCSATTLSVMGHAAFRDYAVRTIGILENADSGTFACAQAGPQLSFDISRRHALDEQTSLAVVEASNLVDRTLIVRHVSGDNAVIGALLTPAAIAVDMLPSTIREKTVAELRFSDGTLIATLPARVAGDTRNEITIEDAIEAETCSAAHGFCVAVRSPFAATWASYRNLQIVAALGSVLCAILAIFGAAMFQRRFASLDVRIRRALRAGAFVPFYQPIVDIRTGRISGCEVLMRWRQSDGSYIPPVEFIEKAEETGLIVPMTEMVMRRSAEELREVCAANADFRISFNLVDSHFDSFRIVETIETIFDRLSIPLSHVAVEVTERRPLKNVERARIVIRRLQSLGVRVALDDVGTGHSGLAHLQQLGVDTIKIDKFFIDVISRDGPGSPFVESLVSIADHLGMDVVAEGVETYDQLLYLREHGVHKAQGYLFGRPTPREEFLALLERAAPIDDAMKRNRPAAAAQPLIAAPSKSLPTTQRKAVAG